MSALLTGAKSYQRHPGLASLFCRRPRAFWQPETAQGSLSALAHHSSVNQSLFGSFDALADQTLFAVRQELSVAVTELSVLEP